MIQNTILISNQMFFNGSLKLNFKVKNMYTKAIAGIFMSLSLKMAFIIKIIHFNINHLTY